MKKYYVYTWIRLDKNTPFYVGKGSGNRFKSLKNRNNWFMNIVNKLGMDNIEIKILKDNLEEKEAFELEKEYIAKYNKEYNLVNVTSGGEGSSDWYKYLSDEDKEKHKEISKSFLGRKHSEETKFKISESAKGRTWSNEYKKIFSEKSMGRKGYWKGKNIPKEAIEKRKEKMKGRYVGVNNPNYGNGHKIYGEKNRTSKPVFVIKDGEIILEFVNGNRCAEYFESQEVRVCRAKIKQCLKTNEPFKSRLKNQEEEYGGYIFIYKEDYVKTKPQSTIEITPYGGRE